jgi:hypothetical protein
MNYVQSFFDLKHHGQKSPRICDIDVWRFSFEKLKQLKVRTEFWGCPYYTALAKNLNLDYDKIIEVPLDFLNSVPPPFWSLVKLYVASKQTSPFYHIDNDVILFKRLPESPFLVQSEETYHAKQAAGQFYAFLVCSLMAGVDKKLVESWIKAVGTPRIYNFGVFGGTEWRAISQECEVLYNTVSQLKTELPSVPHMEGGFHTGALEQILLPKLIKLRLKKPVKFLLRTPDDASKVGYCHLLGDSKENPAILNVIRTRLKTKASQ